MKYKEANNSMLQVALIIAFNFGRKYTKFGMVSGTGSTFLLSITTNINTTTEIEKTRRKTVLSFMGYFFAFNE
jgi:hypothetical protein